MEVMERAAEEGRRVRVLTSKQWSVEMLSAVSLLIPCERNQLVSRTGAQYRGQRTL
jgi:hypothetical protein